MAIICSMNLLLFSLLFLSIFALINFYIYKRLILKLDARKSLKHALSIFLVINYLGIVGYMFARYSANIPNWIYFLLSVPIGIVFLLFCAALVYDLLRVVLFRLPLSTSRRAFFKKSLDISSFGVAFILSARAMVEARTIVIEKVDIKIKNLKQSYKIVQISDLHIGGLVGQGFVKEVIDKVNALSPDLVVITGDLIDIEVQNATSILDEFKRLKPAYGVYYIVGNHEYFHGIKKIIENVKMRGIRVLENENVHIGPEGAGFNLAGVYDLFGYRMGTYIPNIHKALANRQDAPTILLAHQPKFIEEVGEGVDLMLSGHTHGGQIYPFRFLVRLSQPYISGLHQHTPNLQIYVNRGTGYWGPPMRLGASSEITQFTLEPDIITS